MGGDGQVVVGFAHRDHYGGPPFVDVSSGFSLSCDPLRTILAVKGSFRRANNGAP
jgi:hypothetical protein